MSAPAESLRGLCEGRVHLPGDPGYDAARMPWNLAADQRPAAVAVPRSVEEVRDVVRAAVAAGLRIAPQSTGHGATALAAQGLDDVVVVRLSELTGVSVDPGARVARVVGGTHWQEVIPATAAHGLTALHGSAHDVAVAGYVLSGGVSFFGRRHGLAVNSLRAVELVTADGSLVRASAEENPDLFWAVRGGGGSFGVVVAFELELLEHTDVYAGMLLWDAEHAPEVVRTWAAWTRDAPESATTSLRVMSFPPVDQLPPFLRGRHLVIVDGALLEDDERATEILAPLRALAPEMDTFARIPAVGMFDIHMDPPAPVPAVSSHALLADLPDEAIEALLDQVGPGREMSLRFAELRQLGGAFGRPVAGGGVVSHLDAAFALYCIGPAMDPEMAAAGRAAARAVRDVLERWSTGRSALNFTDDPVDLAATYGDGWQRLCEVRSAYDPDGVFVANHPVR
jgi:FAD/FMN-containing dehydrogenase